MWKQLFLEMFVSVDLLGATYMFISIAQKKSKHLASPYKLSPDICHVRYHEKKISQNFSSLDRLPFFSKIFVFNNFLGPKEMPF